MTFMNSQRLQDPSKLLSILSARLLKNLEIWWLLMQVGWEMRPVELPNAVA